MRGSFTGPFKSTVENVVRKHTGNFDDELLLLRVEWWGQLEYESEEISKSAFDALESGVVSNPTPNIPLEIVGDYDADLCVEYLFFRKK